MRNRLDFVPPGMIAGQIARVDPLMPLEHERYWDGPGGEPMIDTVRIDGAAIMLAGHPFIYSTWARVGPDGPRAVELGISSPDRDVPITRDDLRKLARYLDRLAYAAGVGVDVASVAFHQPEKPLPKRPGRRGHGQAHYAEVAEIAKAAHRERQVTGLSARQRIAQHYTVSEATADKYLAKARKAGFLKAGDLGGRPRIEGDG